jgi:hypothetical protein
LVSGQSSTPLYSGDIISGSIEGYNYYSFVNDQYTFEIDLWRTQTFYYPTTVSLMLTVIDPNNNYLYNSLFFGQQTINALTIGNHSIIIELISGVSSMTYQIRACNFDCYNDQCPYTFNSGYCNGNGACISGSCYCDNTTSLLTLDSYYCSLDNFDLGPWGNLLGLWIALIIVAFLLVIVLPIVICVCCCGVCAAAANAERHPIIHHHHPSPINPAYATGPVYNTMAVPMPGVSYVQAQPAAPYQPGQPMFQGQQPIYQQPFQPQQQPPYQPQQQPSLYPKNENYEKV